MRLSIVFASVSSLGLLLMAAACSEEVIVQQVAAGDDAGSSGSSGKTSSSSGSSGEEPEGDGGASSSSGGTITITPNSVKAGNAIVLGVTSDEQIIYIGIDGQNASLEAVPVAGGAPEVIEAAFDLDTANASVSGGAVAYWTAIDAQTGLGTMNLWTKAGGKKTALSATSMTGLWGASEDGTRVAFTVGAGGTDLTVVNSATATAATSTGILPAGAANKINLAAGMGNTPTCVPRLRFAKKNLIAAFCAGTTAADKEARLYWVPENSTTEVRLDNVGPAAGPVRTTFFFDNNATKIFAVSAIPNAAGGTDNARGRIITVPGAAAATSVALEDGSGTAGIFTDDSTAVIYRTATGGLKRASTGATPAPKTLVATAKALLGFTPDKSRVFFANAAPTANGTDIHTADTTTENQTAKPLVTGQTARPLGLTETGSLFVYVEGNKINSIAAAGGTAKDLTLPKTAGAAVTGKGNGVIFFTDPKTQGTPPDDITLVSLQYLDAETGKYSNPFADSVPTDGVAVSKGKFVYTKIGQTGAGIYVAPLP